MVCGREAPEGGDERGVYTNSLWRSFGQVNDARGTRQPHFKKVFVPMGRLVVDPKLLPLAWLWFCISLEPPLLSLGWYLTSNLSSWRSPLQCLGFDLRHHVIIMAAKQKLHRMAWWYNLRVCITNCLPISTLWSCHKLQIKCKRYTHILKQLVVWGVHRLFF